jgi:Organic solvent tolerance protein OstA
MKRLTPTPKTLIKKNVAKDTERLNNNSTNIVENEDIKKQDNLASSEKVLVEDLQQIQKEINNSYLSATTGSSSKGVVLNCGKSSLLFPKQTLSTDTESLDVLADHSEISKKDNYLLTGNVSLNSSQYYLAADTINIQKSSKTSMASGNVKFQDDELMFTGDKATVKNKVIQLIPL